MSRADWGFEDFEFRVSGVGCSRPKSNPFWFQGPEKGTETLKKRNEGPLLVLVGLVCRVQSLNPKP